MAVAFLFEIPGADTATYDMVMGRLERADVNAPNPPGFIAHIAGPTDEGYRAVDVWESAEQAGAFYGTPLFQNALSVLPPVTPQMWPLHRLEIDKTMRHLA